MNQRLTNLKIFARSLTTKLPDRLKRYGEKQMLVILIFILFGDSFKFGRLLGLSRYNWIQGHFSDIGLPAQFTTAIYYLFGHKRSGVIAATILPPVLFSLYELTQFPNSDPVDIVCYFLGALGAVLSLSLYKQRQNKKHRPSTKDEYKINP